MEGLFLTSVVPGPGGMGGRGSFGGGGGGGVGEQTGDVDLSASLLGSRSDANLELVLKRR